MMVVQVYVCKKKDTGEILALKIMDKTLIWTKNKVRRRPISYESIFIGG
jgi:hypothetical protein